MGVSSKSTRTWGLCHAGKDKLQRKTSVLPDRGQIYRCSMRSNRNPQRLLREAELPGKTPLHPILRFKEQQAPCVSDQQFFSAGGDDRRTVSQPLAGGVAFQVDQTASPSQGFLWHHRERRQDPDMDRLLQTLSYASYTNEENPFSNRMNLFD